MFRVKNLYTLQVKGFDSVCIKKQLGRNRIIRSRKILRTLTLEVPLTIYF